MPTPLFVEPGDRWGKVYWPSIYPLSPASLQAGKAKQHILKDQDKKWGWVILGVPEDELEPHSSPPLLLLQIRDPVKDKAVVPLTAPTETPLGF